MPPLLRVSECWPDSQTLNITVKTQTASITPRASPGNDLPTPSPSFLSDLYVYAAITIWIVPAFCIDPFLGCISKF